MQYKLICLNHFPPSTADFWVTGIPCHYHGVSLILVFGDQPFARRSVFLIRLDPFQPVRLSLLWGWTMSAAGTTARTSAAAAARSAATRHEHVDANDSGWMHPLLTRAVMFRE